MQLTFILEKSLIADDHYIISLKANRKQQYAILDYYPSYNITLPISWAGESQGIGFIQFANQDFTVPLPPIQSDDVFGMSQRQSEIAALTKKIESLVRNFMLDSPSTRYSDRKLVLVRIERTKAKKRNLELPFKRPLI